MAVTSFTLPATFNSGDQVATDLFYYRFVSFMDAIPTLTRVTDQKSGSRTDVPNMSLTGEAPLLLSPITGTGGSFTTTGTTSGYLTGVTWSTPLDPDKHVGLLIRITYAGVPNNGNQKALIQSIDVASNIVYIVASTNVTANGANALSVQIGGTLPYGTGVTVTNFFDGYLMYRFNDSLQSAFPTYIKIKLGMGYGGGYLFEMSVGSELDGRGGLRGVYSKPTQIGTANPTGASTSNIIKFVHGNGRFLLNIFPDYVGSNAIKGFYSVSRSLDKNGAQTDKLVHFIASAQNSSAGFGFNQSILSRTANAVPNQGYSSPVAASYSTYLTNFVYDGSTAVLPVLPLAGRLYPFCKDVMLAKAADYANGSGEVMDGCSYLSTVQSSTGVGSTIAGMALMTYLLRND